MAGSLEQSTTMKKFSNALLPALLTVAFVPAAFGQNNAKLHGHVTNAAGLPQNGEVKLTTDTGKPEEAKFPYDFKISDSGDYSGSDIAPGKYEAYVFVQNKYIDRYEVTLAAGDDKVQDFDMSREEYLKTMTPEERKQVEDYKKQHATAAADNAVIANLNKTLADVRADLKAGGANIDKDVTDMKAATAARPAESILWMTYGDVLTAKADHLAADDKKAGKPALQDDAVTSTYSEATDAYKKGIDLNAASKKPSPADQAVAYNQMGSAFAHAGKVQQAQDAYEAAAKLVPTSAGMYYGNEAAVLYNASQQNAALGEPALAAANKAIEAEPTKPDPYFVKGQILLQKATVVNGKITLPDGCEDAYQHYLSIAPDGKFAPQVKEILAGLNIKINTSYKAPSTKKK